MSNSYPTARVIYQRDRISDEGEVVQQLRKVYSKEMRTIQFVNERNISQDYNHLTFILSDDESKKYMFHVLDNILTKDRTKMRLVTPLRITNIRELIRELSSRYDIELQILVVPKEEFTVSIAYVA